MSKKPVKKSNYSNRYDAKQRKEIALHYVTSESYTATGKKFGCSAATVKKYVLENQKMVAGAQKKKETRINNFIESMINNAPEIKRISDMYLEELTKPAKRAATSSRESATVYGILIDKELKLEEIRIKRLETELKKKEIAAMEKGVSINITPQLTTYGKRDQNDK